MKDEILKEQLTAQLNEVVPYIVAKRVIRYSLSVVGHIGGILFEPTCNRFGKELANKLGRQYYYLDWAVIVREPKELRKIEKIPNGSVVFIENFDVNHSPLNSQFEINRFLRKKFIVIELHSSCDNLITKENDVTIIFNEIENRWERQTKQGEAK